MKNEKKMPDFDEGAFSQLIIDFISYKRTCGLKYEDSAEYTLHVINRKLNSFNMKEPILSKEMVESLTEKRIHESYFTQAKRVTLLRQLAIYLNYRGLEAYIYPDISMHNEEHSFVPYIFTDSEIDAIFSVADHLPNKNNYPFYHRVYPVLIRLLYSCGLRLSEALNLKIKDVNQDLATLHIDNSKNSKTRIVAMSTSMNKVLHKYIANRYGDMACFERYVFEAPDGRRYSRGSVRGTILKIFKCAQLPHLISGRHPRVHDLRHQFSIKAMEKMHESGMDLYCALPLLSMYLGHKGIRETEHYLRLPDFRMNEIASSSRKLVEDMIPEVNWDDNP